MAGSLRRNRKHDRQLIYKQEARQTVDYKQELNLKIYLQIREKADRLL